METIEMHGWDEGALGFRLTTKGIEQAHRAHENTYGRQKGRSWRRIG
jgi:hypothetical protein